MSGGVMANWPIAHAPCQVTGTGPDTAEHVPAPAPGALPDSVASVLRRLYDAAAAHDED
jgi:hypothetical protein